MFFFVGCRYSDVISDLRDLYASTFKEILKKIADDIGTFIITNQISNDYVFGPKKYENNTIFINFGDASMYTLQQQFEGNRYRSNHLLGYMQLRNLLRGIQQSYVRKQWQKWKSIYHEKQITEFNLDATFGICARLYQYRKDKWHRLKLSFAHIEDGIGFVPAAILLANASESHEKTLDFISDVFVENLRQCRTKQTDGTFRIRIGTDACKRDVNVPDKILPYIYKKLNLLDESLPSKVYKNDNGLIFDFDNDFQVIVKLFLFVFVFNSHNASFIVIKNIIITDL